jgi:hypothetical protein
MSGPIQALETGNLDYDRGPDLDVDPADYYGIPPAEADNAATIGLTRGSGRELHRVSYLFLLVFGNDDSATGYGGMQLRAQTFIWLPQGNSPSTRLQRHIQNAAHRAAHLFDSSVETPAYGSNQWASGYLSGFDAWENAAEYANWEIEPVSRGEVHTAPGIVDWSTEIYLEVEGTEYARLSGVASGLAHPWSLQKVKEEGEDAVHIPPTKWEIGYQPSRDDYVVRPQGRTNAASRYVSGAGTGKTVYVNGLKIGGLGPKGRVWLNPEYHVGDGLEYQGNHSRQGLIKKSDEATPQALRRGGVLYQTGETEDAVYLRTKRALPDDYQPADPDTVPIDLEVQAGRPDRIRHLLTLDDPTDPLVVECREDREVIRHLGISRPPYRHSLTGAFRHPGFREIQLDDVEPTGGGGGQQHIDDYGKGGRA